MASPLNVNIQENSEQFRPVNVSLIVDWTQDNSHLPFHYDITSILPQETIARFIDDTSIELTMPYNISYNISVTTSLCDRTLTSTIFTLPLYAKAPSFCDAPVLQPNMQATVNYSQPRIAGTIISFTCLPGQTLSGSNTTICRDDGQWIPSPDLVKYKGVFPEY